MRIGVRSGLAGLAVTAAALASVAVVAAAPASDAPPYNTVRPSISGTVAVGETLSASAGTWNGSPAPTYSYQWQQCTSQVGVSTTFASLTGTTSSFPEYVRLDPSDNVFSGNRDTANISKLTPAGVAVDSAGGTVSSPFTWAAAQSKPFGMALDSNGNVYTANRDDTTITKADIRGTTTTLVSAANASNVAVDSRGYVYAASFAGNSVSRFDPGATTPAQTFTSAGGVNFFEPFGMAFDSSDNLYLVDRGNNRIVKITPAGATSVFGSTGSTGNRFGIAVDAGGNVYTASGANPGEIRKLLPDGTPAGGNWPVSIADPWDVAIGPDGNVYVSRGTNGIAGDIFRITPAGIATDVGKTGNWPLGISFDAAGNIYVANRDSSTITKVTTMTCSDISGATASSYTLQAGDAGKQLRVEVTAVNGVSPDAVAYSAITTGPKNTAVPAISGTTAVGQTLTTSTGSWSAAPAIPDPAGYSYQWQQCESTAVAGDTWVSQTTVANGWYGMEWGGPVGQEKFVAVAGAGTNAEPTKRVMTSPDGVTWTLRDTPNAALNSVVWGGLSGQKKFVAVGPNNVMTSLDGETWTAIASPSSVVTSNVWRSVTWGGPAGQEVFVAVAFEGKVMTSPDGLTWTEQTSAANIPWFAVTWGDPTGATPGQFVAVADGPDGSSDRVMTSPDGVNWTRRTTNDNKWAAVTFGGPPGEEKFVAVAYTGSGNRVMTSPDGVTWTTRNTPVAANFDAVVWGGIPGQERFVAVSDFTDSGTMTGMVMTSPDGNAWTARDAPSYNRWHAVEWGGPAGRERFVAVAYDGGATNRAMTSSGPDCTDISGAASQTYTAQPADYQKHVRSRVTADNGVDPDGVAYSSISSQITGQAPVNAGGADAPTITGTAKVGETLTADKGTWTATPAIPDPSGYSYQWQRCTAAGSGCSNISSATSSTYTAQTDDYDRYLRVEVTANNGVTPNGTAVSASSSQVAGIAPTNAGGANAPTLSGTATVGQTLTAASPGVWSGTPSTFTYAYQWQRCDAPVGTGSSTYASTGTQPYGIAFDSLGNLYASNFNNGGSGSVTKTTPGGGAAGSPWPVATGDGANAIVIDGANTIYTADFVGGRVTKIAPDGTATNLGATGSQPWGIALDGSGNVYTTNDGSITKFPAGGGAPVTISGLGRMAGIVTDPTGNVYATDYTGNRVHKFDANGTPAGGAWPVATGAGPYGLVQDAAGNLYTSNISGNTVTKIAPDGTTTMLGMTGSQPWAITLDAQGNVYTANAGADTVTLITPAGVSTTLGTTSSTPRAIAIGSDGNVYTGNFGGDNVTAIQVARTCTDIATATNQTYVAQADDYGKYLRVRVTAANGALPDGVAYSTQTGAVAGLAPANAGGADAPSISGTAKVGETLTAANGTWTAAPAIPDPAGYSHQWQRCDSAGANCTTIASATNQTYTLVQADAATTIRVQVTANNGVSPNGTATSSATASVTQAPTNTAAPSISGTAEVGQTLTAANGTWVATPAIPNPAGYSHQWQRCDAAGANCTSIASATNQTYTLVQADAATTIRVQVTANNGVSPNGTVASPATSVIPQAPVNTTAPTITGSAAVGETLTATTGTWSASPAIPDPAGFSYQWQRCASAGANCAAIAGATASSYVVQLEDVGAFIRVAVTADNGRTPTGLAYSLAAGPVVTAAPTPAPAPSPAPTPTPTPNPEPIPSPRATTAIISVLPIANRDVRIGVRVNQAGTIRIVGAYPAGTTRSSVRACTARRTVTRSGTHELSCRLSPRTRALLTTRSLRITFLVTFTTDGRRATTTRTVLVKRFTPSTPSVTG